MCEGCQAAAYVVHTGKREEVVKPVNTLCTQVERERVGMPFWHTHRIYMAFHDYSVYRFYLHRRQNRRLH